VNEAEKLYGVEGLGAYDEFYQCNAQVGKADALLALARSRGRRDACPTLPGAKIILALRGGWSDFNGLLPRLFAKNKVNGRRRIE